MRPFNMVKFNKQDNKRTFQLVPFEIAILDAVEQTLNIGYYLYPIYIYKSIKLR